MIPETQDIVHAVLFSVVLVFNIAGNSLVIYIITNERGMKTSTNYLLFNLAVADLLFGVFLAPLFIFLPFFPHSLPDGVLGNWLCKLLLSGNIAMMASKASVFTMLCLSVERYFAVCRPHSFSQRFSSKIVKVLVVMSWVYAIVVMLPIFLGSSMAHHACSVAMTISKGHSIYVFVEAIFSLLVMILLNGKIFISLWCKQAVEPTGEREITERKKKKKVTLCVLAVVVTFVLCWIPTSISYVRVNTGDSVTSDELVIKESSSSSILISTILVASVNAALDPYLFSFQSSRFKVLVKKNICCRKESS